MMNLLKKSANNNTKTAVQMTKGQKPTTTVANISSKVKTAAFGVATGAGVAGSVMLQNERNIHNRKARAEYHKKVESVCTVAVGAAVVGAGAAIVQGIFDPVIDVSTFEIEPEAYLELNNKAVELDAADTDSDSEEPAEEVETVEAEIVPEKETAAPASAPKAEKPVVEATATEVQTPDPKDGQPTSADPAPVAPQAEQPVAPAPAAPAEKPSDSAAATQTNQGNNAQDAKSQTGEQKPKDNGQGESNNNSKNGNHNNAKAAK